MKTTTIILLIVLNIILIIKFEYIKKQFNKQQNNESWEKNEIAYATFKSYIYEYQKVYINNICSSTFIASGLSLSPGPRTT